MIFAIEAMGSEDSGFSWDARNRYAECLSATWELRGLHTTLLVVVLQYADVLTFFYLMIGNETSIFFKQACLRRGKNKTLTIFRCFLFHPVCVTALSHINLTLTHVALTRAKFKVIEPRRYGSTFLPEESPMHLSLSQC